MLASLVRSGKRASELLHLLRPGAAAAQERALRGRRSACRYATCKAVIADAEAELAGRGRLVIRASGTEPLIRVMAEGDDAGQVERVVDSICDAVRTAAA